MNYPNIDFSVVLDNSGGSPVMRLTDTTTYLNGSGTKAKARIQIPSVPPDGYNIIVATSVAMGGQTLGSYVKNSGDTTEEILAASIAAALATAVTAVSSKGLIIVEATLPADGQNVSISLPVSLGGTLLGNYVKQPSDTTQTILTNSIKAALTLPVGYSIQNAGSNAFYVVAPASLGAGPNGELLQVAGNFTVPPTPYAFQDGVTGKPYTITAEDDEVVIEYDVAGPTYNGENLVITSNNVTEVNAVATFNVGNLTFMPTGREFTIRAQKPDNSLVIIGTYTKQADDTTEDVMGPRLVTAITGNADGYVPSYSSPNLLVTAPNGLGATQNGKSLTFSWTGGSSGTTFIDGITAVNVIPNIPSPFAGGANGVSDKPSAIGYFEVTQPDGVTVQVGSFASPSVSWDGTNLTVAITTLRLGTNGQFQNGGYTIVYHLRVPTYDDTALTKQFTLNYKRNAVALTPTVDVFTPIIKVTDATSYAISGLTQTSVSRGWEAVITGVGDITGPDNAEFDMQDSGDYFDAEYIATLVTLIGYSMNAFPWVALIDEYGGEITVNAYAPVTLDALLDALTEMWETMYAEGESKCGCCETDRHKYSYAFSLFEHYRSRGKCGQVNSLFTMLSELKNVLGIPDADEHTLDILTPYDFSDYCAN